MLPVTIYRRPTLSALLKLATIRARPLKRSFNISTVNIPLDQVNPTDKDNIVYYSFNLSEPLPVPNPTVTISIWDSIQRHWNPCETKDIKLRFGNSRILLEKQVEFPDWVSTTNETKSQFAPVCSIEWRNKETELMPAFIENVYTSTTIKQLKNGMPTPCQPIFYFGLNRRGQVGRAKKSSIPFENTLETEAALRSLLSLRDKIEDGFTSIMYPDAIWMRLECKEPVDRSIAAEILLGTGVKRFQLITELALPCRGKTPFLQGDGRFELLKDENRVGGEAKGPSKPLQPDERRGKTRERVLSRKGGQGGEGEKELGEALAKKWKALGASAKTASLRKKNWKNPKSK